MKHEEKICPWCKKAFISEYNNQKFCSNKHMKESLANRYRDEKYESSYHTIPIDDGTKRSVCPKCGELVSQRLNKQTKQICVDCDREIFYSVKSSEDDKSKALKRLRKHGFSEELLDYESDVKYKKYNYVRIQRRAKR
jgi:hypothetical protein